MPIVNVLPVPKNTVAFTAPKPVPLELFLPSLMYIVFNKLLHVLYIFNLNNPKGISYPKFKSIKFESKSKSKSKLRRERSERI